MKRIVWPNKRLKKVPLPFARVRLGAIEAKLDAILYSCFRQMFFGSEETHNLSTSQRREWGRFLAERGIAWEIRVRHRPNWEGWEASYEKGCFLARPKGLEDHVKINHYFVPRELATRMLVLGEIL